MSATDQTGAETTNETLDETLDRLGADQHGVVTRAQLLAEGLTRRMVERRVRSKRLRVVHHGVYQVGPTLAPRGREMAAVLACGPGSFVSYRSAGGLWQILARTGASAPVVAPVVGPVDVTVVGRDAGRRRGIRAHRVARLTAEEVTLIDGIPVTSPARTILDLARILDGREMERALARAERRELFSRAELASLIERHRGRPGMKGLARLCRDLGGPALTRSEAEIRFLELVRSSGIAVPEVNVMVLGYEIDFFWRSAGLAVEVDGFAFHSSWHQVEADRRRDTRLAAAGIQVIRITWRQIVDVPTRTIVDLARILERRTVEPARAALRTEARGRRRRRVAGTDIEGAP
jgi:very-short-patch-repair endonuclease